MGFATDAGIAVEALSEYLRDSENRTGAVIRQPPMRALALEVGERVGHLDVLVNNAAVFMKERVLTVDGFETTFAVNHLAPFLLTGLLLEPLRAARAARVVNVSSMAHEAAHLDFDNLQGERRFDGFGAYALSKLANVLFTLELAERLQATAITANCLHPGVVTTKLLTRGFGITGIPVERGSRIVTHLALDPGLEGVTGNYFMECRPAPPAVLARESGVRRAFWELTESLVGQSPRYTRSTRPLIWQVTS
jgi:NAD(P)-dependent dehydrogenase (short-subunit alcohol dehydrogenase family)